MKNNGFSLIEAMIAIGIMSVMAIQMSQLSADMTKTKTMSELERNGGRMMEEIANALAEQTTCNDNFQGHDMTTSMSSQQSMFPHILDADGNYAIELNHTYFGNLQAVSIDLRENGIISNGAGNPIVKRIILQVRFKKGKEILDRVIEGRATMGHQGHPNRVQDCRIFGKNVLKNAESICNMITGATFDPSTGICTPPSMPIATQGQVDAPHNNVGGGGYTSIVDHTIPGNRQFCWITGHRTNKCSASCNAYQQGNSWVVKAYGTECHPTANQPENFAPGVGVRCFYACM